MIKSLKIHLVFLNIGLKKKFQKNEVVKNIADQIVCPNERIELIGQTNNEGIEIKIIFEFSEKGSVATCNIISFFPLFEKGD